MRLKKEKTAQAVRHSASAAALVLVLVPLAVMACNVDLFGFFASSDLDIRLKDRNRFVFLRESDRAPPDLGAEYEFLVLTDTHIEGRDLFGLEKLRAHIGAAKFLVVLGDITQYSAREDIQAFIDFARDLGVPVYPVIGNHDVYHNNYQNWKELIGSTSYLIETPRSLLVILDSANAYLGGAQLDRLEYALKNAGDKHVFVFTHTNLFVENLTDLQQLTDQRERARIIALLAGKKALYFSGHIHKRLIRSAGGVQYISIEDFKSNKIACRVRVTPLIVSFSFESIE